MRLEPTTIEETKKLLNDAQEEKCFIKTHHDSSLDIFSILKQYENDSSFAVYNLFKGRKRIGIVSAFPNNEIKDAVDLGITYIKPKYRGRGFGKTMVEMFIKKYKKDGFKYIFTKTWSGNESAMKMYQGLGFVKTDTIVDDRENGDATIKFQLEL